MIKTVWCRTSFVGFHRWPGAPDIVGHLRNTHRHIFGVEVSVLVTHSDRFVEFQMLKKDVERILASHDMFVSLQKFHVGQSLSGDIQTTCCSYSCEQMAEKLGEQLSTYYGYKLHRITVDEDGENGATLYYDIGV